MNDDESDSKEYFVSFFSVVSWRRSSVSKVKACLDAGAGAP